MSDALSEERLAEIRSWAGLADAQYGGDPEVDALLAHIDHLTAEVDRLRADVRSLRRGSQRNADAHMVTHRDNARLRDGIEALADSWEPVGGRWLQQMDSEDHVRVDCGEQMLALLVPRDN